MLVTEYLIAIFVYKKITVNMKIRIEKIHGSLNLYDFLT
jgi:hypothetical protein